MLLLFEWPARPLCRPFKKYTLTVKSFLIERNHFVQNAIVVVAFFIIPKQMRRVARTAPFFKHVYAIVTIFIIIHYACSSVRKVAH